VGGPLIALLLTALAFEALRVRLSQVRWAGVFTVLDAVPASACSSRCCPRPQLCLIVGAQSGGPLVYQSRERTGTGRAVPKTIVPTTMRSPQALVSGSAKKHDVLALAFVFLAALSVNVAKPLHIDDTAYLEMAHAILREPLHPLSQTLNWGDSAEPIFNINQPPLLSYLMALIVLGFGQSELTLHLFWSLFSLGAIAAFHHLAKSASACPVYLTCLFALGPAFLPGQGLMFDIPLVALWCLFFSGLSLRSRTGYLLCASAMAVALLVKYTSLVLLPVFAVVVLSRRDWRAFGYLAIPLSTIVLWSLFNLYDYGAIHILGRPIRIEEAAAGSLQGLRIVVRKAAYRSIAVVAGVGLISPFVLAALPLRLNWASRSVAAISVLAVVFLAARWVPWWDAATWAALFCCGLVAFMLCAIAVWRDLSNSASGPGNRDRGLWLGLWIGGTALFLVLMAPFMAIRHVLLVLPPILLAFGSRLDRHPRGRLPLAMALGLTAALGVLLAISDLASAQVYRTAAREIRAGQPAGMRTWTVGHWGWQFYAKQAGMLEYDARSTCLAIGDTLVRPMKVDAQRLNESESSRLALAQTLKVAAPPLSYLRTVFTDRLGGYHSFSFPEVLPLKYSKAPFVFQVFTVVRSSDSLSRCPPSQTNAQPEPKGTGR